MDINEIYELVRFISNKSQTGTPSPSEFNLAVNSAQFTLFMERYGNPAEYVPGQPIPRMTYEGTKKISDDLRVFKVLTDLTIDTNGQGLIPDNYIHATSMRFNYITQGSNKAISQVERPIVEVDDDKLGDRLISEIVAPTKKHVIATFYNTYIQYHPKDLVKVKFTYLRRPNDAVWAFTTTNGRPVYDVDNSTDLEWPDDTHNEIVIRTLSLVGINLRDGELTQYSVMRQQQGI